MEKSEIEALRNKVSCAVLLEQDGWTVDLKESTPRAVKHRRGEGEIIIVIHGGKGWFDPLSDAKGDVFSLAEHLGCDGFVEALQRVGDLVGFVPSDQAWTRQSRAEPAEPPDMRWQMRTTPRQGSPAWRYLTEVRAIPAVVVAAAVSHDLLREGPKGSMWAAHSDADGAVIGWEERGPDWRGFASGGAKELFRFGVDDPERLCITEAAIDAMSLAAIDGLRPNTLYVSTGGGWSPATEVALRRFALRPGIHLAAATDNNPQGEIYAERLHTVALETGCGFERLRPLRDDWNACLTG